MCFYVGFLIVIISTFFICSMCFQPLSYGSTCGEGDNLFICKKLIECPSALKAVEEEWSHPYQRCGFMGPEEILCCPDFPAVHKVQPLNNENNGSVWGSSTIRPINTNSGKKSAKACDEYISKAIQSLNTQITAGVDARLKEFLHMAQIGYDDPDITNSYKWNCGASLIHPRFVLTAAHCIQDIEDPPKIVRLGFVDSRLPGAEKVVERYVRNYTSHPDFNGLLLINDIALIELTQEITRSDENVYPACLYQTNDDPNVDLIVTGWGHNETGAESPSRILQKAYTQPSNLRECAEVYKRQNKITEQHICCLTINSQVDTCQGDSGGPLQLLQNEIKNVYAIVGVTSFGGACGDGTPGVYARVSSYIEWIESIVWP